MINITNEHIQKTRAIVLSKTAPSYVDKDDLISEGLMGLLDARRMYKRKRGKFWPYAAMRIRGSVSDYLRKADTLSRRDRDNIRDGIHVDEITVSSLEQLMDLPGGHQERVGLGEAMMSNHRTPHEETEIRQLEVFVAPYISSLKGQGQIVVRGIYWRGMRAIDISRETTMSESRISQVHKQVLAELRKSITGVENHLETT